MSTTIFPAKWFGRVIIFSQWPSFSTNIWTYPPTFHYFRFSNFCFCVMSCVSAEACYKATHSKWISRVRWIYVSIPAFKIETESRMKLDHNWSWQLMSLNKSQLWKMRLFCNKKNVTFSGSYELETTSDKSNSCSCFVQVSPSSISLEIFAHQATLQIMKKVHQKTNFCQYLQEGARSSSREGFFLKQTLVGWGGGGAFSHKGNVALPGL